MRLCHGWFLSSKNDVVQKQLQFMKNADKYYALEELDY